MIVSKIVFFIFFCSVAYSARIGAATNDLKQSRSSSRLSSLPWWLTTDFSSIGIPSLDPLPNSGKACIPIDETVGVDNGLENAMWYFREDMLVNAQHIFWHLSFPTLLNTPDLNLTVDRRGELFYYFHRNMLARYDAERLSNGFDLVKALRYEEGALIEQGYDPHFQNTNWIYPPRPDNVPFVNISDDTEIWQIIGSDINNRMLISRNGSFIPLNNAKGIDHLGDLIEASINNLNDYRYSFEGVHNSGHGHVGSMFYVEPTNLTAGGVMINPSTSMRDPVFYRWHKYVDDVFYRHQSYMIPHHPEEGEFPLAWSGVSVDTISVHSVNSENPNSLRTYFKNVTVAIPITQDIFMSNENIEYCMKRLDYDEFTYSITIDKQTFVTSEAATVRVFMAPRFNFAGTRFSLEDQIRHFFALDAFTVELGVGKTIITRNSSSSSLNLNWKLENWTENPPSAEQPQCGCGWPSHLLLPKGNAEGMAFDLFVMLTDAELDSPSSSRFQTHKLKQEPRCEMGMILCGIEDAKYPDVRPLGFPFDSKPFSISTPDGGSRVVADLEEYVSLLPNTKSVQVIIKHE